MEPAEALRDLGDRQQRLVTAAQLRRAGVHGSACTRALATGRLHRVRPAVYGLGPLPPRPAFVVTETGVAPEFVLHARAALLALGGGATATGRTAAALRGWGLFVEPARLLDLAVPHPRGRAGLAHVRLVRRRCLERELLECSPGTDGLWVTSAVQTALDGATRLPLLEAVCLVDSGLRSGQLALDELTDAVQRLAGGPRAAQARRAIALADPESGSVLESVLRVRLRVGGVEPPRTQQVVRCGPQHARVDFRWNGAGLVVETDGAKWHPDPARDQARDNLLARAGWRMLRYTWAEVVHEPERVLAEIREALLRQAPDLAA